MTKMKCIEHSGEFVINYLHERLAKAAWKCSTQSGHDVDKLGEFGLEVVPALKVKPPRIKDSAVCFECTVVDRFTTGDRTLFICICTQKGIEIGGISPYNAS
jgi:flavin reductase (DIM6/NTAB) family NADH-FMN oxidoreductase RutF